MLVRIVSGTLGGRRCSVPAAGVRPTSEKVRAALFDSLGSLLDFSDAIFIDPFAGSGAMAFEAFSRGFFSVWAIEKDAKTVKVIDENRKMLMDDTAQFTLLRGDSTKNILQRINREMHSTVVFLDPPYQYADALIDSLFFLLKKYNIVKDNDIVIVETDKKWTTKTASTPFQTKKYGDTLLTWFKGGELHG
ncbi:16S rRNA (guanine(966)-N(2))-methyltransferase RsmD [bacterium]|nr:16S rRNA (guanine(966)-N(2))-methyltransferase RsmD [bacterium]